MSQSRESNAEHRQRVLLVAHCFDANLSMESRLSWFRAMAAAEHYDTTIVCAEPFADVRSNVAPKVLGLRVVTVPHTALQKLLIKTPIGFYLAYRLWHRRVLKVARQLHAREPFALVHQVSYCGYREPGYCWQLGVPFVWGPIGGTQNVPWRFLTQFDLLGAMKESWRTIANGIQLRVDKRVGDALQAARVVYAANREIQQSFRAARGVKLPRQLETGVQAIAEHPRPLRDKQRPLRVLWMGRLEHWKALPMLLRAVSQLSSECAIELRIVGSGSRERRLKRLANRLKISDRIEWVSLPSCDRREEHYAWADVFVFTSLRDTSGTGLLESLAAGVPIVGLNHQGARDIMSESCSLPIAVQTPRQVVADLQAALVRLADEPQLLQRLSRGAVARAQRFQWERLSTQMLESYAAVLGSPNREQAPQTQSPSTILQEAS